MIAKMNAEHVAAGKALTQMLGQDSERLRKQLDEARKIAATIPDVSKLFPK